MTSFWIVRSKTQASRGHCSPSLVYCLSVHGRHTKTPNSCSLPAAMKPQTCAKEGKVEVSPCQVAELPCCSLER